MMTHSEYHDKTNSPFAECELQVYLILSKGHLVENNIKNGNRQKVPMKTGSSAQNLDHFMFLYREY